MEKQQFKTITKEQLKDMIGNQDVLVINVLEEDALRNGKYYTYKKPIFATEFAVKWPLIILFAIHRFLKHIQLSQVKLSGLEILFLLD